MTGMEGTVALGIAGNVVQFIDFGGKLCSRLKEYSAAAGAPKILATQVDCISDLLEILKELSETQKEALEQRLISRCISKATELSALLDTFIDKDRAGKSTWRNATIAWKSLRAEKKVGELQKTLESLLKPLNLNLQAKTAGSSKRTEEHTLVIRHQNEQILQRTKMLSSKSTTKELIAEAITMIPITRNPNFVGREELLCKLDKELSATQNCQSKASLCGLGGVGKTQIALEYAYRWLEQSLERSVFWVHATNTARFEEAYRRIALECDIPAQQDPKEDMMQIVRNWLESRYKCAWLMVVDNVDDINAFFKEKNSFGKSLSEYLPQCSRGSIVYTTRDRRAGVNLVPGRDPIEVYSMSLVEARLLLGEKVRGKSTEEEQKQLLEALVYLPLAISQAISFMAERRQTISQYLTRYRQDVSARTNLLKHEFTDHGRETRPMESVATTFMISFDYIRKENPRASDLLSVMSFLDRQGVPKSLILDENDQGFDDAIGMLDAFSLIATNDEFDNYELHRLVRLATRTWLSKYDEGEGKSYASRALELLSARFPDGQYENWTTCAAYLPHAEIVLHDEIMEMSKANLCARATLLLNTSRYYESQGRLEVAELRMRESLELRKKVLGDEHPSTLTSFNNLALVLSNQGKYEAAEEMNRRVLEGREKVLGEEHPDTLTSVNNLALVLSDQGKYEAAEEMNRRALEGREKVLGEEHPDTLTSVNNLALVLSRQGKYEAAEEISRRALEGSEKVLGEEHPDTLTSVNNLALVLSDQGKYEAAEEMNRRALEGNEKVLGEEHPNTLTSASNLALVLSIQGVYEAAEEMNRRVLEGREKVLGEEHPSTLTSVYCLAYLLHEQKRWDEAISLYLRAYEGYNKILGSTHPTTQACIGHYSSLVREMQQEG